MKRKLLLLLLSFVLLSNIVKAQDEDEDNKPIKVDTLLLTTPLVVRDNKGRYIAGLKKENFSIFQNRQKQEIEFFFGEESPMNVAILLDTSASTKEVLDKIQQAARDFVKVFRPEDKGVIVGFDNRTLFLSDLTSDKKQLSKSIREVRIAYDAGSDMNDAVLQIVQKHFASVKGRKAIIALTDGMVIKRNVSTQQTLDALLESDTVFYPIVFKTKFYAEAMSRPKKPLPVAMLEYLADGTAGRFYEKEASNLKEAFESISDELKKQYLIGFYPQNTGMEKSLRNITITVDRKDSIIETKKKWSF
jgi:Ca-activated chloride channel family protein